MSEEKPTVCEDLVCELCCREAERRENPSEDNNIPKSPIAGKYKVRTTPIPTKPGCWEYLNCEVLLCKEGAEPEVVGNYTRMYSSFYNTFEPFIKGGKEYALISSDYTATSIISLPDCKVVASEQSSPHGFCPTGFYVPWLGDRSTKNGCCGFVCGCVWGDDSSWKVEYLDLSKIEEGIIRREKRWGYLELPASSSALKYCVRAYTFPIEENGEEWANGSLSGVGISILGWQSRKFSEESDEVVALREENHRLQKFIDEEIQENRKLRDEIKRAKEKNDLHY